MRLAIFVVGLAALFAAACGGGSSDEFLAADDSPTNPGSQPTPLAAGGTPTPDCTPRVYTVVSGDTLLEIAIRFEVELDEIISANAITDPNFLSVGQQLLIPCAGLELTPSPTPDQEQVEDGDTPTPGA
jgi:LysM repeat protein